MSRLFDPNPQFDDAEGNPLASGTLTFYATGTSTLQDTYNADDLLTANTNPVVLTSAGRTTTEVWLDDSLGYRVVLKNSAGTVIWDRDPWNQAGVSIVGLSTADEASNVAALRLLDSASSGDAIILEGYYAAGDGGGGTFYWDAASAATDNGGTVIKPTATVGNGRWLRLFSTPYRFEWFGATLNGTGTGDLTAFTAINSIASASALPITAEMKDGAVLALDASGSGNEIPWSSKLLVVGGGNGEQNQPIILINHANTYFKTETLTSAENRAAGFGIDGVALKGYNTATANRWDDDTTGGERNVTKLWNIVNAQPRINGDIRNAVTLLLIDNSSSAVFPEQIKIRGRLADYGSAIKCTKSGSGTGSFEHMDVDVLMQQGVKAATTDYFYDIATGCSVYRGRSVLRGHAHNSGGVGAILKSDGTFNANSVLWLFDRLTINNLWNLGATASMRQNTGYIKTEDAAAAADNINASATVGENNIDIRGPTMVNAGITISSNDVLNARSTALQGSDTRIVGVASSINRFISGSLTSATQYLLLPAYRFGVASASGRNQKWRLVSVDYDVGTQASGNTNGGWMFNVIRTGVATLFRFQIPNSSSFGTIRIGVDATGAARAISLLEENPTAAAYDNPFRVSSATTTGSVNNGTAPADVHLTLNFVWL